MEKEVQTKFAQWHFTHKHPPWSCRVSGRPSGQRSKCHPRPQLARWTCGESRRCWRSASARRRGGWRGWWWGSAVPPVCTPGHMQSCTNQHTHVDISHTHSKHCILSVSQVCTLHFFKLTCIIPLRGNSTRKKHGVYLSKFASVAREISPTLLHLIKLTDVKYIMRVM